MKEESKLWRVERELILPLQKVWLLELFSNKASTFDLMAKMLKGEPFLIVMQLSLTRKVRKSICL